MKGHIKNIKGHTEIREELPSGLRRYVTIGRFLVQSPLGARPGLGTQPRYEAPGDLRVKNRQKSSD